MNSWFEVVFCNYTITNIDVLKQATSSVGYNYAPAPTTNIYNHVEHGVFRIQYLVYYYLIHLKTYISIIIMRNIYCRFNISETYVVLVG